jgi:hypothetical protein
MVGLDGAIGSHSWQATNTGVEPGWWVLDTNHLIPGISLPETSSFLTPTGGALVMMGSNNSRITNSYDHILWGSNTSTNYYVATALPGTTIVLGTNVVLVLPNGIKMSGSDALILSAGSNIAGTNFPPASITVYSGGASCTINGNAVINESGYAGDFLFFCASTVTNFSLNSNGVFQGALVAPNADVSLNGAGTSTANFVGCLIANSVLLNGNWAFHYDESLERILTRLYSMPQLTIISSGSNVIMSWPAAANFTLQSTGNLTSQGWTPVAPVPPVVNGQNTVTNSISGSQRFFRLSQ